MDVDIDLLIFLALFICGVIVGLIALSAYHAFALGGVKKLASDIIARAEEEVSERKRNAEFFYHQKELEQQKELELFLKQERRKIHREEERLKQKEDKLEERLSLLDKKILENEKKEIHYQQKKAEFEEEQKRLSLKEALIHTELETLAGLTSAEAKHLLMQKLEEEVKIESANYIRRSFKEAEEEVERYASTVITTAINRLAVPCTSEATVCTVALPSEEIKGRIIGREGRNIRALERETGVNFLIDDTPGAIVISGLDPMRKQIAKMALQELVQDGRIHPTRIEELVAKATVNAQKLIKQHGEDAALRVGVINLHPELILLLGKLKFRYSYGQNVLDHSLEVAHLMGLMASELNLDVRLAKRIGLLHDVGKALTHEIEGSHAIIGYEFALKYGEKKEVANGIGCHHGEMAPLTVEADLCRSADAISASRYGARLESVEEYIKRWKKLEDIAYEFPGVEKADAMQAGRELRVFVTPQAIDDNAIIHLARDITKKIETELNYPGKIKVTVFRETKSTQYAL